MKVWNHCKNKLSEKTFEGPRRRCFFLYKHYNNKYEVDGELCTNNMELGHSTLPHVLFFLFVFRTQFEKKNPSCRCIAFWSFEAVESCHRKTPDSSPAVADYRKKKFRELPYGKAHAFITCKMHLNDFFHAISHVGNSHGDFPAVNSHVCDFYTWRASWNRRQNTWKQVIHNITVHVKAMFRVLLKNATLKERVSISHGCNSSASAVVERWMNYQFVHHR